MSASKPGTLRGDIQRNPGTGEFFLEEPVFHAVKADKVDSLVEELGERPIQLKKLLCGTAIRSQLDQKIDVASAGPKIRTGC